MSRLQTLVTVLRKPRTVVTAAAVVFGLVWLANIPASLLYAALASKNGPVQLFGLDGPWAEGHVAGITVQNRVVAEDLRWTLRPAQLLLARIGLHLSGGGQVGTLEGGLALSPRATRLSDFRIVSTVKRLAAAGGYPFVPVEGQLGANIKTLVMVRNALDTLEGSVDLKNLQWTLARDPMLLGDFHVEAHTTPEAIIATINSPEGPLSADGTVRLLPDRSYEVDVRIKPKPGASEMLMNYVKTIGAPDPQGDYHWRQKGTLP
jgi:general secretion pathway protein N